MPGQNHRQNFDEVVDGYYERIFRGALAVTGDKYLAEEIVQETFVSAFKRFNGFSGRASVFSWLYAIMLNKHRDHCRRRKLLRRLGFVRENANPGQTVNMTTPGRADRDASPHAELADSEESELLMEAVYGLPILLREAVAMRYFDGLPLNEVAEILDCPLGTVKSRLANARKRLYNSLRGKLRDGCENEMPKG